MVNLNNKYNVRHWLLQCFQKALSAVEGEHCVYQSMVDVPAERLRVIAIGKAADAMLAGVWRKDQHRVVDALVIGKIGYLDRLPNDPRVTSIEAGHPVPDADSLRAGNLFLERLASGHVNDHWLVLLSGGASSLVEVLPDGYGLDDLQRLNQWLLASGLDIRAMNAVRQRVSCIKGGKANHFVKGDMNVLAISDVPNDDPAVIGSGLFYSSIAIPDGLSCPDWIEAWLQEAGEPSGQGTYPAVPHRIVANLDMMLDAIELYARESDVPVLRHAQHFDGDAEQLGRSMAQAVIDGDPGLTVWGGESTLQLPGKAGLGGRNQHLALAAATVLNGHDGCYLLSIGSDGTDGPTDAAGALVDGETVSRAELEGIDINAALASANAYPCLEASGDLIMTGPTGTNVTDVVLGIKLAT